MREDAWEQLLHLLRGRDLSAREAQRLLEERGHPRSQALSAVRKAHRLGLIDDEELAQNLSERRSAGAPRGVLRVTQDLERREIADEAALKAAQGIDDAARCAEALALYLTRNGRPEDHRALSRLLSYLARQGFTEESVRSATAAVGIEVPWDA